MSTESVKVLNAWPSMYGMRVLIALKQKGVAYEYAEQDLPSKSKLLLESNPVHKKIPVLIHNGKPICESLVIVQYIDEAWPSQDKPILPKDPYHRALARFWADYVDKTVIQYCYACTSYALTQEDVKVFDAGMRVIWCPKGEQREQAKKDLIECLATLDGGLREVCGGGPYFSGQNIGLVDIALAPFLCWVGAYETLGEFKVMNEAKCPHLCKWAKSVGEYPSVKEGLSIAPPHKVVDFAHMLRKKFLGA